MTANDSGWMQRRCSGGAAAGPFPGDAAPRTKPALTLATRRVHLDARGQGQRARSIPGHPPMLCEPLLRDFRKDLRWWLLLLAALAASAALSYLEGNGIAESTASVLFLAMFMMLTAALTDLVCLLIARNRVGLHWLVFALAFACLAVVYHAVCGLTPTALGALFFLALVFASALALLIVVRSR